MGASHASALIWDMTSTDIWHILIIYLSRCLPPSNTSPRHAASFTLPRR